MAESRANLGANPSLKQLVYEDLKLRIINGELKPGIRLLEEELSMEMNISRAPIREAFNMLERDSFTTIIPRKGAIVAEITKEDIHYIWETRKLLEPYAAQISFKNIPDEDVERLKRKLNKVTGTPGDFQQYMDSDLELHELFSKYLENRFLKSMLENIKAHTLRMRWAAEQDSRNKKTDIVIEATKEHLEIIGAIEKQDEQSVYEAVLAHVYRSYERTVSTKYGSEDVNIGI